MEENNNDLVTKGVLPMRQNKKEIQSQRTILIGLTTDFHDYTCEDSNAGVFMAQNIPDRTGKNMSKALGESRSWN